MLIEKIKSLLTKNTFSRRRRFLLSADSLTKFAALSKSSQTLLIDLINRIRSDKDVNALIITGKYDDFGYEHRTAFYRDRKRLTESGFIIYEQDAHYVNPCMLEYHNRKQRLYLLKKFGLKQDFRPSFGSYNK